MVRLTLLTTIALAAICLASVTARRKIPLKQIAINDEISDRIPKFDTPPNSPAFFLPGDEL